MKYLLFSLSIVLFTFQGCSTKTITPQIKKEEINNSISTLSLKKEKPIEQEIENSDTENLDLELDEEFGEEFKEEVTNTSDPLSSYNEVMTSFNDKMFIYAVNPISEAYAYATPQPVRLGISNFIHNIKFPIRFINNILQGKLQNSSDELERFIINSTVGIAGLMDPAKTYKQIPAHNEDFGQTLGHYGIGSGFHIVLPFFGPSNLRDTLGLTIDGYSSPLTYTENLEKYKIPNSFTQSAVITGASLINKNSLHLGEYESLKKDAIELYPFLRDIYEQKRTTDIAE